MLDIMSGHLSSFNLSSKVSRLCLATASDLLLVTNDDSIVVLVDLQGSAIATFEEAAKGGRFVKFVESNNGDKVYVYDSEDVLYLWNPHTKQIVARTIIQGVRTVVYSPEDDTLFVLSHGGSQLQVLNGYSLELASLFVSMEQELIEYTYDHDVLDLANLETSTIFTMQLLETDEGPRALALFSENGTVLVLAQATNYKVRAVFRLLPLIGGIDEDATKFSAAYNLSKRLGMFLLVSSEGPLIYTLDKQLIGLSQIGNLTGPKLDLGETNATEMEE